MKFNQIIAALPFIAASACFITVSASEHGSIDKVLGSAVVASNQHYANISLVNGSIQMASNSSAKDLSVVNGSIDIRDHVSVQSISTVNGSIETGAELRVAHDMATVNGRIRPGSNAVIGGNIDTTNGDIELNNSEVGKTVSTVNGDISLTGTSVVKGDLVFKPRGKRKSFFGWGNDYKPSLHIGKDATVEGSIILQQEVQLEILNPAMQDKVVLQFNDGR